MLTAICYFKLELFLNIKVSLLNCNNLIYMVFTDFNIVVILKKNELLLNASIS